MKSQRNIARQLPGLTLTLVGLMCWNTLPIHFPERAVQAATRARVTEPTGQPVSRAVANGRIAFVSRERNASSDIYTMNPDGSDRKQLTFSQEYEYEPVWSPDGTKIAFASVHWNGNVSYSEILVMNADGSDQRRLTQSKFDHSPTWSPDGTKIAFWRIDSITMPSSWGIFVMNADGSDPRAVASTSDLQEPAWSPDGLKFAVIGIGALNSYATYLINVDGSNRTQITQPSTSPVLFEDHGPAWSPDGSKITFTRCDDSNGFGCWNTSNLWAVNADGSNPTKLTDTPAWSHAWSPDGTKIIFGNALDSGGDVPVGGDLLVMNPDGSGLTNITNTTDKHEESPSWQPLPLPPVVNPIDDPQFFVRQHYRDFLGREPDPAGLAFWTNEITACGGDAGCVEAKRVNVSAAFFLSIEFQETGVLVYRARGAAFGTARVGGHVPLTLTEFLPDTQRVGQGVVVNTPGWEQRLEQNKQDFFNEFVGLPAFLSQYAADMPAGQFVDTLNANAGGVLSQAERDSLVSRLGAGQVTRAQALREVVEDSDFRAREFNRAFVLMEYFGYLRRNPSDAPDTDFGGYDFWLGKLNQFNGNYIQAEMVKAFSRSGEYRQRFGQP